MSQNIEIKLKAIDEASATIANASTKINGSLNDVSNTQKQISAQTKVSETSMKDFAVGASGAATSVFSFYSAIDRVQVSEISLDRANLMVKSSSKSVDDAQRSLSVAIQTHGVSSQEAKTASDALSIAQDRLSLADERAQQAQDNVNKSMIASALQVVPTTITMVDSLSKAWKNMPDISALITKVSGRIAEAGISAKTAAIGVAAFMGGFLIADTILGAIPEDMRQIAGALMASIAAIVAATVAWMAFHGTMTIGVAVPIILAAVGVGIAGVKAAVAMAEGGVVDKPTYALIGEAGPEIVMPLKQYELQISESRTRVFESLIQNSNVVKLNSGGVVFQPTNAIIGESNPEIVMSLSSYEANRGGYPVQTQEVSPEKQPNIINIYVTNYIQTEADYDKASEHTIESLNEALARRRSS